MLGLDTKESMAQPLALRFVKKMREARSRPKVDCNAVFLCLTVQVSNKLDGRLLVGRQDQCRFKLRIYSTFLGDYFRSFDEIACRCRGSTPATRFHRCWIVQPLGF
ncbi:hypothetical protein DAA51_38570 [Bradyrhizobium sp. WBAH10]|nr:hypothetical protein [Bradyrhizobium sp. WBAH30]MDD1547547.1 hypothetical protein [Bradyrhizobium sp. WBAH41]MDD1561186.1 hypothetical protein [Bradyrhizobium sp. WBAH23]MDD1568662.1 hypothetical protein [Bradyrhizobium sp. WBAH33]MDD1594640.1 hypothetical protein [Bradyrhizobium sp. WBAH42]NRB92123.1 hypothetical protein [Bradyrhizobium sp. WBAH10]QCJ93599.1 hypothetical protein DAA57_38310 [Bradyrhizobium yuanmingense]